MTRHRDSSAFIQYLQSTIQDLAKPLEEIFWARHENNSLDVQEIIKSELYKVANHFATRDKIICDAEAAFIQDIEVFLGGESWDGLTNIRLAEIMQDGFSKTPDIYDRIDLPKSVEDLRIYDEINGTDYTIKASTMFFRFANAVAKADGKICQNEQNAIYSFKEMLFNYPLKENNAVDKNTENHRGNYKETIQDYTETIPIDLNDFVSHFNRGCQYYENKQFDEALSDFTNAVNLAPDNAIAYEHRGNVFYHRNEFDKAIADYNKSISLEPEKDANTFLMRGLSYYHKENYAEAIENFTEAITLNSEYITPYKVRGHSYYYIDEYDKAINDYTTSIELNSDDAGIYFMRGTRCLVPKCDGVKCTSSINKESLWDKFYTVAPQRQRHFAEQYKIVKKA